MKLYLVRHGNALDKLDDAERPLSAVGEAEADSAGRFLKRMTAVPQWIYHSQLLRSRQTSQRIAEALGFPERLKERKGLRPEDSTDPWVDELNAEPDNCVIVGHLPFLPALASALLTGSEDRLNFKYYSGSVLCLEREDFGGWRMRYFVSPKIIARLMDDSARSGL